MKHSTFGTYELTATKSY